MYGISFGLPNLLTILGESLASTVKKVEPSVVYVSQDQQILQNLKQQTNKKQKEQFDLEGPNEALTENVDEAKTDRNMNLYF